MKSVLLILALLLTLTSQAPIPRDVFVDQQTTTATATQDGTSTYPYKELSQAFSNLSTLGGSITFVQQTYTLETIASLSSTTSDTINISLQGPSNFQMIVTKKGYVYCQKFNSILSAANLKNVKLTFNNMQITGSSSFALFNGSCNYTIQNSVVHDLNSSLFFVGYQGNVLLQNIVIEKMSLNADTYLIDHDSIENLGADYLTLDNVIFKNSIATGGTKYAMIKSFIQYAAITVTNSYFEGVGFNIKGEQIGGNKKSDITVKNITMKDSTTFFFIESFGTVLMQDSTFENASERAILYFLTDENLSPNQTTTKNCTFRNNKAPLEGAAIAFQGSKETSYQFTLNVQIIDSSFFNNNATLSGGALAFLLLRNGNFTIYDSEFISNTASEGGGAIHVDQGDSTMTMHIFNNNFESNTAFTGGVFDFEFMNDVQVTLHDNTYTNNSASFEGGLGFVSESTITLTDTNSIGTKNSANFEGGAWSLKGQADITFTNIQFIDTVAFLKGGCIFNSAAFLTLQETTFQNCSLTAIGSSGGAVFISEDATISISDSTFTNNQAETGASIIYQSAQSGPQQISDITITFDLTEADLITTIHSQIRSDSDGLVLKDITIPTLKTPFLSHSAGTIQIDGLDMTNVECKDTDSLLSFCIFDFEVKEGQNLIGQIQNVDIQTVYSSLPLIVSLGSNLTFSSVNIEDVESTASVSVASIGASLIKFDQLTLTNIDSVWITTEDGYLTISNSKFNNQAKVQASSQTLTQFIVSSNDQIDITSSSFDYNSAVYPTNGGALSLVAPTSFTLQNLDFSNNQAIYGGAIYIQSATVDGLISDCTFDNNRVFTNISLQNTPGFGGAIFFTNSSSSSTSRILASSGTVTYILIEGTTFNENSGYTGGAIYTRGLNFTLDDVSFTENQAVSGGALAVEINQKDLIIYVTNSEFLDNNADLYGASYLQLRENVTRFDSTVIRDGTQLYTTGAPALLRIRTYNYSSQVLLDSSRNIDDLLAKGLIVLDYDSFISDSELTLTNVSSGGYLSKLMQITVCDASKQPLTELTSDEGNVTISVLSATYPKDSTKDEYSLAGIPYKTLTNGSAVFLDEMNIFAFPETLLEMQVTVLITQKMLGNLNYNIPDQFKIQLNNCSIGQIFHQETLICDPCKPDYFSLTDPFTTNLCQKCDDEKADCPGGSIVYPKAGYWRISAYSDNVVTCPNTDACLGGQIGNLTNLTGFCDEGYTGNACATCVQGWGKFGSSESCTNCDSNAGYYVKLFALLAIQVTIIVFNVYSNLGLVVKRTFEDYEKEKVTIYQSTVIKVLVDYAQVLGIVAAINIKWPIGLGNFGNVVSNSVPSSKDSFSIDCFLALGTGNNDHIFFYKILALNIQPFIYIFFGTMFWVILTKIKKQNLRGNQQLKDNILVTNILIAYILQPEIVKSTLQLFKCVNLGPLEDPEDYLQKDMQILCGSSVHLRWALGVGVPSLIIWLGMPIAFGLAVFFRINKYNNEETLNKYHFLFKRYKKDKIYWDLTIIVRKAALIFFLVFLTDLYSQIFFSFAVFIFCLHLHYKNEPYSVESLNHLETLGLISNCSLLFGGLFFIEDDDFGVVHGFLMAVAFLINLLFLYRVAKALWHVFSKKIKAAIKMLKEKKFFGKKKVPKEVAADKAPEVNQKYLLNEQDPKEKNDTPSNSRTAKGDNQSENGKESNDSANHPKEESIMFPDLNKELELDLENNDNDNEVEDHNKKS